jgi:hypothetical protein
MAGRGRVSWGPSKWAPARRPPRGLLRMPGTHRWSTHKHHVADARGGNVLSQQVLGNVPGRVWDRENLIDNGGL